MTDLVERLQKRIIQQNGEIDALKANQADAAVAAIAFVLSGKCECEMEWLRLWNGGDFDSIREEWPETPEACFIGADPLMDEEEIEIEEPDYLSSAVRSYLTKNLQLRKVRGGEQFVGIREGRHVYRVGKTIELVLGGEIISKVTV